MHLSIFCPPGGGGGQTRGFKQHTIPDKQEFAKLWNPGPEYIDFVRHRPSCALRRPSCVNFFTRWCYIPNMKALGIVVSDKKVFENCILKTFFWPRDLLMQPTGTIWTALEGTTQVSFLWSLVKIKWAVSEEKIYDKASSRGPLPKLFKLCPSGQNWFRGSQFYIELYKEKLKRYLLLNR